MKKTLAIVLIFALVLSFGAAAFADQSVTLSATVSKSGDTVTLTITLNEALTDVEYMTLPISWDTDTFEKGSVDSSYGPVWGKSGILILEPDGYQMPAGTIAVLTFTAKDTFDSTKDYTFTVNVDAENTFGHKQEVTVAGTSATLKGEPEPTEPPVEPTEPPVEPTEPPVEPTEPPVEPTEPPAEPTPAPTEKPAEPTPAPTEKPAETTPAPTEKPAETTKPTEAPKPTQKPVDPKNPTTGDESNLALYVVIMFATLALGAVTFVVIRKGNKA